MTDRPTRENTMLSQGLSDRPLTLEGLRHELAALDLPTATIDSLCEVVPIVRHVLNHERRGPPTMTAQRQALDDMVKAAKAAREAFGLAWNLTDSAGLGMALRTRLDDATGDRAHDGLDKLLDSLAWAELAATRARGGVSDTQARSRAATLPIRLIHERVGLAPSTSSEGRFRQVTVLIYRAAGHPVKNPDAAIRSYLKGLDSR